MLENAKEVLAITLFVVVLLPVALLWAWLEYVWHASWYSAASLCPLSNLLHPSCLLAVLFQHPRTIPLHPWMVWYPEDHHT